MSEQRKQKSVELDAADLTVRTAFDAAAYDVVVHGELVDPFGFDFVRTTSNEEARYWAGMLRRAFYAGQQRAHTKATESSRRSADALLITARIKDDAAAERAYDEVYGLLDGAGQSAARAVAELLDEVNTEAEENGVTGADRFTLLLAELRELEAWARTAADAMRGAAMREDR